VRFHDRAVAWENPSRNVQDELAAGFDLFSTFGAGRRCGDSSDRIIAGSTSSGY